MLRVLQATVALMGGLLLMMTGIFYHTDKTASGLLIITSDRDGGWNSGWRLYMVDLDSGTYRPFSQVYRNISLLAWSSDGRHALVLIERPIEYSEWQRNIVWIDWEGHEKQIIADNLAPYSAGVVLSNDGQWVAYVGLDMSIGEGRYNIFAFHLDHPHPYAVIPPEIPGGPSDSGHVLSFSPDNRTIVFWGLVAGKWDYYRIGLDGKGFGSSDASAFQSGSTTIPAPDQMPPNYHGDTISPNQEWVLLSGTDELGPALYRVRPDGSQFEQVTSLATFGTHYFVGWAGQPPLDLALQIPLSLALLTAGFAPMIRQIGKWVGRHRS